MLHDRRAACTCDPDVTLHPVATLPAAPSGGPHLDEVHGEGRSNVARASAPRRSLRQPGATAQQYRDHAATDAGNSR
jgi:hypothetical protein